MVKMSDTAKVQTTNVVIARLNASGPLREENREASIEQAGEANQDIYHTPSLSHPGCFFQPPAHSAVYEGDRVSYTCPPQRLTDGLPGFY